MFRKIMASDGDFRQNSTRSLILKHGKTAMTANEADAVYLAQGFQENDLLIQMFYDKGI
ncbi:MAG TPA: hypothetical protein PKN48_07520 [Bacteroidales bacterium]|nr:hypothetical protein [Bacteroidales bacterium]